MGRPKGSKNKPKVLDVDKVVIEATKLLKDKLDDKNAAQGVAIHSVVNSRTSSGLLQDVRDYSDPNMEDRKKKVELARKLRDYEGICGSVADLLTDFAITDCSFYSDNDELKDLLNTWAKNVRNISKPSAKKQFISPSFGLRSFFRQVFDDYLVDGDAIFSVSWENGVNPSKNEDKNSNKYMLPVTLKMIDSLNVKVDESLASFGFESMSLILPRKVQDKIKNPKTDVDRAFIKQLPKEWVYRVNKGEDIVLDPNITFHIKRKGKDYKPWGESLFTRAFGAIANKRRLQAVDEATIDGLINRFTIFTLGLADREKNPAYHVPSPERVTALVNVLTDPKRANAAVWPGPDLNVIDIGPDGKILEFDKKYAQADIDILRAMHVSPLLIDGGSTGNTIRDWAAFLSTEVGLEAIRNELIRIFLSLAEEIALVNKLSYNILSFDFDSQLLKDEKRVRNFALEVYRLGGMSVETFVEVMGYDFAAEKSKKEKEKLDGTKELFVNENVPGFTNVNGRPEDTTNEDLSKDSNPGKKDITNKDKAALSKDFNINLYYELYLSIFNEMESKATRALKENDINLAELYLLNGFTVFKNLIDTQISEVYLRSSKGNKKKDYEFLIKWNDEYIDAFYNRILKSTKDGLESFKEEMNRNKYRLYLYAQESYKKAFWLGQITLARISGKTSGVWFCSETTTREFDKEKSGKEFDLDYLMENFPGIPNSNCIIDFK